MAYYDNNFADLGLPCSFGYIIKLYADGHECCFVINISNGSNKAYRAYKSSAGSWSNWFEY